MSKNALRIGVAGLGRIGKIHFDNLRNHVAGAELVAVAGRINNAFRRLGSGWAIFVEAQRVHGFGKRALFPL